MAYIPLAKLHQLFDGFCQPVQVAGNSLLLVQEQGKTYLIANQCPHQGASLHRATINNGLLRCPAHGMTFDLASGRATHPAACPQGLQHFPLAFEGNTLGVYVEEGG